MEVENNELFKIDKLEHTDNIVKADLSINPNSPILKGHFPGQPVVPGACMLQIAKEVMASALSPSLQLIKANQLKFINMIDPLKTASVQLEISYKFIEDEITITGKLSDSDRTYFKFQTVFYIVK
jgi:3-hydroxyacyl-[acyl-carrier-protein] dehydratase